MRPKFENTRLWLALRIGQNVRLSRLAEVAAVSQERTKTYMQFLAANGYVKLTKTQCQLLKDTGSRAPYRTTKFPFIDPNLAGSVMDPQQRIWDAIRILERWTLPYLADVCFVSVVTVQKYSLALVDQGMAVKALQKTKKSRGRYPTEFRLVTATGPDAPLLRTDDTLFDPNLFRVALEERYGLNLRSRE